MNKQSRWFLLVVAALLCAAIAARHVRKPRAMTYFFEVSLRATNGDVVQVFYDDSREGFSEARSVRLPRVESVAPQIYQFLLPAGTYYSLRFDPTNGDAPVTIGETRIVTSHGQTVHRFAPADFAPLNQIAQTQVQRDGGLEVQPAPGANDVSLTLQLKPPLSLPATNLGGIPFGTAGLTLLFFTGFFIVGLAGMRLAEQHEPVFWSALVALLGASLTLHHLSRDAGQPYFFSVTETTTAPGEMRLYYDTGEGLRLDQSTFRPLAKTLVPHTYNLPLSTGRYRQLLFAPVNHGGTATITEAKIVSADGQLFKRFVPNEFRPASVSGFCFEPIPGLSRPASAMRDELTITPAPGADSVYLLAPLDEPLLLPPIGLTGRPLFLAAIGAVVFAVLLFGGLAVTQRLARIQPRVHGTVDN